MLGERLLANGAITAGQLEVALSNQQTGGALLGETLLALNLVSEQALAKALADEAGLRFVVLNSTEATPAAVALVPEAFARERLIAPLSLDGGRLEVLQANPFDVIAVDELASMIGHRVVALCGTRSDVLRLIERSYVSPDPRAGLVRPKRQPVAVRASGAGGRTAQQTAATLLDRLMVEALRHSATDLLIEPGEKLVRLRYRADGALSPGDTAPKDLHPALLEHVRRIAGLKAPEPLVPQDGRAVHSIDGRRVDLRVSTFPTVFGEKVSIRIVERTMIRGLADLGLGRRNLNRVLSVLDGSAGLALVTGPAGAGKTTTLYSLLAYLARDDKNVQTVEDPIECELPGVRQSEVDPDAGVTFAAAVRTALRENPDVLMIAELRDRETARLALHAAASGVLVLSAVSAGSAVEAVRQLAAFAADPAAVGAGLQIVIAQRLVRLICAGCGKPASYPPETLARIGLTADAGIAFRRGRGCELCRAGGYRGRTGAFEVLPISPAIRALVRGGAGADLLQDTAVREGLKTLQEDALQKAIFGQTTIEEVHRIASE
jgi:type IV pilus assembly protein PilB